MSDIRLHLTSAGVENEPVLFLHGFVSSGRLFQNRCQSLAARHTLLFPDLLGFGESPRPADSSYDPAAHILALQHTLTEFAPAPLAEKLTLVTHSMGGLLALEYAARFPQIVKQLILFNLPVYWSAQEARQKLTGNNGWASLILRYPKLAQTACNCLCRTGLLGHILPIAQPNLPRDVAADMPKHSWTSLSCTLHNTFLNFDIKPRLEKIQAAGITVSLFHGQYDKLVSESSVEKIKEILPSASLHTLATGHYPFFRHPDLCLEAIQSQLHFGQ